MAASYRPPLRGPAHDSDAVGDPQLLLILPPDCSLDEPGDPAYIKIRELWQSLSRAGFYVVLAGHSTYTLGLVDGLLYIAAPTLQEQDRLLAGLGDLDTVVAVSHPERHILLTAERRVYFDLNQPGGSSLKLTDALFQEIRLAPRKKKRHLITAGRLQHLRTIYTSLVPLSIRIGLRLGPRLRVWITRLKK